MGATRIRTGFAIAALLASGAALAAEPESADGITVGEALEEPADPDDEANIRADNDPDDVGQLGLDPEGEEPSPSAAPSTGDHDLPDREEPDTGASPAR